MPPPILLQRLKERKLVRWALTYLAGAWVIYEAVDTIGDRWGLTDSFFQGLFVVLAIGFFITLVLAWYHGEKGRQRVSGPELLMLSGLLVVAGVAVTLLGGDEGFGRAFGPQGEDRPVPPESDVAEALPEDYVAVFPFENLTGEGDLDDLGPYTAFVITEGLRRTPEINQAVAFNTVAQALEASGGAITTQEIAVDLQVGTAITGVYAMRGDSLEFLAEISRIPGGDLIESVQALGAVEDPRNVIDELRQRITGAIAVSLDEAIEMGPSRPPTYEAFLAYRRGYEVFLNRDWMGALPHFQEAFRLDSTFLLAPTMIGWVYINTGQRAKVDSLLTWATERWNELSPHERLVLEHGRAFALRDREEAFRVRQSMFRMDPTSYADDLGHDAVQAGRPQAALDALSHYDPDTPSHRGSTRYWYTLAQANHMLGLFREELDAARQGRERFPDDLQMRWYEMRALVALSRLDEIEPLLGQIEEIEPNVVAGTPGGVFTLVAADLARFRHSEEARVVAERAIAWYLARDPDGFQSERAYALLLADRPAEALTLLEPLVEQSPENLDYHGLHGMALALTGDNGGAEAEARWCEETDRPNRGGVNKICRASILSHLGREEEATDLVRQALQEGLSFWGLSDYFVLNRLWGYEPFERLISPKG
ncbi:MAG: hypothetical protein PVJ76_17795 [Gemmatimonadota bacterium]|jgi:tetratricopeptide (TPR) repeat protein